MSLDAAQSAPGAAERPARPSSASTVAVRIRARRRPWLFALCAALVAAGGLGSAFAFTSINDTQEVLVLARDVERGEVIEAGDLSVVQLSVDPALTPVSGSEQSSIVGRRATVDLWAGTLLTDQAVVDELVPSAGNSLVGISLTAAQMPTEPLYNGDLVRIVTTPGDQGEITDEDPITVEATVVGVTHVDATGQTVVDVSVPQREAAALAALAATGRVALVLDSRER